MSADRTPRWLLVLLVAIAVGALVASVAAQVEFARSVGASWYLAASVPLSLDSLMLASAGVWNARHQRQERVGAPRWVFFAALAVTLAVNALHAAPDLVEAVRAHMALAVLPPLAVAAAGHMVLEERAMQRRAAEVTRRRESRRTVRRARDTDRADSKSKAAANGHGPRPQATVRTDVMGVVDAYLAENDSHTVHDQELVPRLMRERGVSQSTAYRNLAKVRENA